MNLVKKFRAILLLFVALSTLSGCNVWSVFAGSGSTAGIQEEALKCLHKNDFDCALAQYAKLPDGQLKRQKLCTVNMSKAGFTLNSFLNVVGNQSAQMLGALADAVVPWTETKELAAVAAVTNCDAFYSNVDRTDSNALQFSALLSTLGNFLNCSIRMAKTDQFRATAETLSADPDLTAYYANPSTFTTNCKSGDSNIVANSTSNGVVNKSDIGGGAALSAGAPGMCTFDVYVCNKVISNLVAVTADLGGSSGSTLSNVSTTFAQLSGTLKTLTSVVGGVTPIRAALQGSVTAARGEGN